MSTQNLIPEITQLLLPLMQTPEERDLWLSQAFYFSEPRIYHQIDRSGAPLLFVTRCIKFLWDFGCFSDKTHPLSVLLTATKMGCGHEKQVQIEGWIPQLNGRCDGKAIVAPMPDQVMSAPSVPRQTIETPPSDRTPTVFVSYSRRDEALAKRLIADLNAAGHACWFDQTSIKSDDTWAKAISAGINNSYAFVTLMSEAANASKWVMREYLAADGKPHLPVFVLQLEACDIPIQMIDRQATRLYPAYEDGLHKLLTSLPAPRISQTDAAPSVETKRPVNQRELELEYLSGLRLENWLKTIQSVEQYQTMAGTATARHDTSALISTRFKHLAEMMGEARGETRHEAREYTDILMAIRDLKRAVLLGEPGAGKTTTLWRLAKDLFDTALADPKAPLPILVRLGRWTDADQTLKAFIQAELGELGSYLDKLIEEKRVVLLLDGLNEIPTAQRKQNKDAQVQAFLEAAQRANPDLIGVISCRERDYTLDLGFDKIAITPLDVLRIREFAGRYLDRQTPGLGEQFFWRLAGGEAIVAVWEKWEGAGATLDLFFNAPTVPRVNPNVYSATTRSDDTLWQQYIKGTGSLMTLAQNPYMLTMMTNIYLERGTLPDNRGELFAEFIEALITREFPTIQNREGRELTDAEKDDLEKQLSAALSKVAYTMQSRREGGEDGTTSTATSLVTEEVCPALISENLLYLAASASILTVTDRVRFSHQLLQEYFAALFMLTEIRGGRLKAADLWKPAQWWEPTGWEEATILLAGLFSADCSFVLEWVCEANPEVTAQCIVRSGAVIPDATKEKLRSLWLPRLNDQQSDPEARARAAIGRALSLTNLDNRPGLGLREDGLPDLVWCGVPAGEFIYQYGEKLTLPTFSLAKYPLTYRQFQAFIDAEDGYRNAVWWAGLHEDGKTQQQGGVGDQAFKFWNHPREMVSWYDAIAFCRWLSVKLGYEVRLPTEQEWEKAARGIDGREYAYGNVFEAANGNTDETGIRQTSAVGVFPNGASPYGVLDLSGNVWEWTLTEYESKNSNNTTNSLRRVVRGGVWYDFGDLARAAFRRGSYPDLRDSDIGFRLALSAPV